MQLEACLRSLDCYWPFFGPRFALYKATDAEYAKGYEMLARETYTELVPETRSFRNHVMELLDPRVKHTAFFMDDDIMFQRPQAAVVPPEGFAAVSLRLGINTTCSYSHVVDQQLPELIRHPPLVAWDWSTAVYEFGYPMSLDGSVFATALLRRLLRYVQFRNPNQLEEQLHVRRQRVPRWMIACEHSSLVNIPANIVTTTHRNRAETDPEMSTRALNARFLRGARFDLDAMDFSSITSPHQSIPVVLSGGVP